MLGVYQKDDYDLPLSINDAQKITLQASELIIIHPKSEFGNLVTEMDHTKWIAESLKIATYQLYDDIDFFPIPTLNYFVNCERTMQK